jgi:hypothetical protein
MGVHDQEQRAHQASLRAEEVLEASYQPMRKAERRAKEAMHRAEELKWRIEGSGIRPRSLAGRSQESAAAAGVGVVDRDRA